jgi:hypothetical protein
MGWSAVVVTILTALLVACPDRESQDGVAEERAALDKLRAGVREFTDKLERLRKTTAASIRADLEEQACPEARITQAAKGAPGSLLVADAEFVRELNFDPRWKMLTTPALASLPKPSRLTTVKQATDTLFTIRKLEREHAYVAIVHTTERESPRLEGDRYHGGRVVGWLMVFELDGAKLLCRARLEAQSSDEIAGLAGQNRAEVLRNDFSSRVREELEDAVARISRTLRIDWGA